MIKIRRGLDLPLSGAPVQELGGSVPVRAVALLGADYPGLQPTMKVAEGDRVVAGQALFADKKNPEVVYTAPATGRVRAINRGARRVFLSLVIDIEPDSSESVVFTAHDRAGLAGLDAVKVGAQLIESGLWTALRTRPYSKVPVPGSTPSAIFVNAMDSNPLAADPAVVIGLDEQAFVDGLTVLSRLSPALLVARAPDATFATGPARVESFSGPHPAGLVGTHIHFMHPVSATRTVWHLNYQDVMAIGRLFVTGRLDSSRVISLGGPVVRQPRLLRTLAGASLADLTAGQLQPGDNRVISGSVLSGRHGADSEAYLGRYHLQVSVLAEDRDRELLHYLRPGTHRSSVLNLYLGKFLRKSFDMTTSTNGSERAMVPVGTYEQVMPLDILPTQLLRSLIVGDTDQAQALGCLELDEEDLALCTYACPGKYEYGPILRDVLTRIEKEG
ncbi:Na(+)-translocating NADH-quinone reductase subunit A [Amnimonas aquatica]|uniref:Na(+)-translocating NADH-quinone reductase subunit A n=1 Tax=Amnimonas aquatica TaxID=2094561 RepID=A0A2P6ATU1_9GAMM|nr:Na(+)-translocating NADH-quinone reductase subunit A [Amnimonas aquatica]PQA48568.1 NADH:ubiquinone reductase (Na(+)-transporting) subunit A [Amnimonas aquatica]